MFLPNSSIKNKMQHMVIFKQIKAVLNPKYSFFQTSCLIKAKETNVLLVTHTWMVNRRIYSFCPNIRMKQIENSHIMDLKLGHWFYFLWIITVMLNTPSWIFSKSNVRRIFFFHKIINRRKVTMYKKIVNLTKTTRKYYLLCEIKTVKIAHIRSGHMSRHF